MSIKDAVQSARNLLDVETRALEGLKNLVEEENFHSTVEIILNCKGRVVVSGMGKSGIIGHKIAATLASTGTPAFFMHPGEALHGDLGMTRKEDVFLLLSNSGETEVIQLLPSLKLFGNKVLALTGKAESTLAREADAAIVYTIDEEGCPIGLAPMASTTATLALGDAIAAALMHVRGFQKKDFAKFHPAGSLGRRLLTRVKDLMTSDFPCVLHSVSLSAALQKMIETNLGAVFVIDEKKDLLGLISDGDVKRSIQKGEKFLELNVIDVMTKSPRCVEQDTLAEIALREMESGGRLISVMPVVDSHESGKLVGLLRMHDILQAKIK